MAEQRRRNRQPDLASSSSCSCSRLTFPPALGGRGELAFLFLSYSLALARAAPSAAFHLGISRGGTRHKLKIKFQRLFRNAARYAGIFLPPSLPPSTILSVSFAPSLARLRRRRMRRGGISLADTAAANHPAIRSRVFDINRNRGRSRHSYEYGKMVNLRHVHLRDTARRQ